MLITKDNFSKFITRSRRRGQAAESLLGAEWNRPYTREVAACPLPVLRKSKYWSPVGRVDNVYGDRNLFCSCLPVEEWEA